LITAGLLVSALLLALRPAVRVEASARPAGSPRSGLVERWRWLWAASAFVGGATFCPGRLAVPLGIGCGVAVWAIVGRAEPAAARHAREAARRELPHFVDLLAGALESGLSVGGALEVVTAGLPGAAADRLGPAVARLRLGVPATDVWLELTADPALAPLGRALARAQETGSSVATAARRLADDLTESAHLEVEERARAVGVRAAVPLGVCLLPAFLVLAVVPLVVGAAEAISW